MKRLRIAMLHWGFPPIIGGVETHLTLLCPALVRLGHAVSLLTGAAEGETGHRMACERYTIDRVVDDHRTVYQRCIV